jgi:hypothetical protein
MYIFFELLKRLKEKEIKKQELEPLYLEIYYPEKIEENEEKINIIEMF